MKKHATSHSKLLSMLDRVRKMYDAEYRKRIQSDMENIEMKNTIKSLRNEIKALKEHSKQKGHS